jgi:hypothetical protein
MFSSRSSIVFVAMLVAAPVYAQTPAEIPDADRATARLLAQEGQTALRAGDFDAAADRFARADALVHAPTLLLGLARADAGRGRLVASQESYARILREGVPPGSPPVWSKALAEAQAELAALSPRVPALVVRVVGAPSARVTIDGKAVPAAAVGANRPADPGPHVVRAEADGYAPVESTVMLAEGRVESVTLKLGPPLARDVPPPVPAPAVSAPPPSAPASGLRTAGFAALGVGGAGLVLGAITGGLALAKHRELSPYCNAAGGQCNVASSEIGTYHLLGTLSTVGFVAGGLVAGTGVVLVALPPRAHARADGVALAPVLAPGHVGLRGTF